MEKQKKNTAGIVRSIVEPIIAGLGYMLWDVEYVKEGADMILRITIDSPEGIGIEDCEKVSRAIDPAIDEADPIEDSYRLEVSSPGVERILTRPEHFETCLGEKVEVRLYAPLDGRKQLTGILKSADADKITVEEDGGETAIPRDAVANVSTVFEW